MTVSKRLFAGIGPCGAEGPRNSNEVGTFRRKLTAKGPRAAYELLRASQVDKGQATSSSGIPNTVNIASSESGGHGQWSMYQHGVEVDSQQPRPARQSGSRAAPLRIGSKETSHTKDKQESAQSDKGRKSGSRAAPLRTGSKETSHTKDKQESAQSDKGRSSPEEPNDDTVSKRNKEQGEKPGAFDRLHYESLKGQVKEYKHTVANLQKIQTKMLQRVAELPRHCKWECVSKVLTDVVSALMIGSEVTCNMYPTETELVPMILLAFGITMDQQEEVEQFFTEWGKGGERSIMMKSFVNLRDRRGAILRVLRSEFYTQLNAPKPRDEDEAAHISWKSRLSALKRTREWRVCLDGDAFDPWGSDAIHHSIARVLHGIRYDRNSTLTISIPQAGFFLYNLELAIEGKVMEASRMHVHHKAMKEMEERVKRQSKDMKRIMVLIE